MAYTLYHYKLWPNAQAAQIALIEQGMPYKLVTVDMSLQQNQQSWFLKLNPQGEPPIFVDDSHLHNGVPFSVWEPMGVAEYANARYVAWGKPSVIIPNDPCVHTATTQWTAWAQKRLTIGVELILLHTKLLPLSQRDPAQYQQGVAMVQRALGLLEPHVPDVTYGPAYINRQSDTPNGSFSMADIVLGSTLTYGRLYPGEIPLGSHPRTAAYVRMLETRPSFKTAFVGVTL